MLNYLSSCITVPATLAAVLALFAARSASAGEPFPQLSPSERSLVAEARSIAEAKCDCKAATQPASYRRCVARAAKAEVSAGRLPRKRLRSVMLCAARSTCGRPDAATCCKTNRRGVTKCRVMATGNCQAPKQGTACITGLDSWCDAVAQGCRAVQVEQVTQCCLPDSPAGAFVDGALVCSLVESAQCVAMGGIDRGPGTCTPDPCVETSTTTSTTTTITTTTTEISSTSTSEPSTTSTSTTTTTTEPPTAIRCCVQSSAGGAFDQCEQLDAEACSTAGGMNLGAGACEPNPCLASTTTTVVSSTSTTEPTTTSTSTTTTTEPPAAIRCCVQSSAGGAFDQCEQLDAEACSTAGGMNLGAGACDPNPCLATTTTTVVSSTSTTEPTTTSTSTTTTTEPPAAVRCCVQSSAGGAFDQCEQLDAEACSAAGGMNLGAGACEPNPCLATTTTTVVSSTSTTEPTTTSTSTTTTTEPPTAIRCCVQSSAGGAFDQCEQLDAEACSAAGGANLGAGACDPNPCLATTTTTVISSTSTTEPTTTSTSTTTTTEPPAAVRCCVQSSAGGAFDQCEQLDTDACSAAGGINIGVGACEPNPCLATTTTTIISSTSTTQPTTSTTTTPTTSTTTTTAPDGGACGIRLSAPCAVAVDSPPGTFTDLQDAVDAADDGATLVVEGVCRGPIAITGREDLTIEGTEDSSCRDGGPGTRDLRSTVKGGDHVIKVTKSSNIRFRFLNIIDGRQGLEFKLAEGGGVSCSCVAHNDDDGVELDGGGEHEASQNLILRNSDDGILLTDGSERNIITANTILENGDDGIEIENGSDGNEIEENVIEDNVEDGIDVDDSDDNEIRDNEVRDNGREKAQDSGIELEDSDDNEVDDNEIRGNADGLTDQIRCQSGSDDNTGSNVPSRCR